MNQGITFAGNYDKATAITNATATTVPVTNAIFVGVGGTVAVTFADGGTVATLTLAAGIWPLRVTSIFTGNTGTATGVLALY